MSHFQISRYLVLDSLLSELQWLPHVSSGRVAKAV